MLHYEGAIRCAVCLTVEYRTPKVRLVNHDGQFGVKLNVWRYVQVEGDGKQQQGLVHVIRDMVLRNSLLNPPTEDRAAANDGASNNDDTAVNTIEFFLSDFHPDLPTDVPVSVSKQAILDLVDRTADMQRKEDDRLEAIKSFRPKRQRTGLS